MRRLLLPLSVTIALLLPTSAWADEVRVKDATGDVYTEAGDGHDPIPEGSQPNTDVRRTVVRHGQDDLRVVVQYVELASGVSDRFGFLAPLRLSGQAHLTLIVSVDGDLERTTLDLVELDGLAHDCPDAAVVVKPRKDRVVVTVPRTCLGSPEWIRFSARAESLLEQHGEFEHYTDNLLARDIHSTKRTKRLYVG